MLSMLSLIAVALFTADGLRDRARLDVVLRRLVALTGVTAILGILQYFGVDLVPYLRFPGLVLQHGPRIRSPHGPTSHESSGTSVHAIEFGVSPLRRRAFALHYAMRGPRERRARAWWWTVAILFALPTAVSRSAVVGIVVALVVLAVRWTWTQRIWLVLLGLTMIAAMRAIAPGTARHHPGAVPVVERGRQRRRPDRGLRPDLQLRQ